MFSEKNQKAGIRIRTVFIAVLCCLFIAVTPVKALAAPAEGATVQYSGTSGTVTWEIYTDGTMVIRPTEGDEGTMLPTDGSTNRIPLYPSRSNIKRVETQGTVRLEGNVSNLFRGLENCTEMNLSGIDTTRVTNMSCLFYGCGATTIEGISDWNTSNVTDMTSVFCNSKAASLNLSGWNTSKVTKLLFY